jgi:hypothetical protein
MNYKHNSYNYYYRIIKMRNVTRSLRYYHNFNNTVLLTETNFLSELKTSNWQFLINNPNLNEHENASILVGLRKASNFSH